MKKLLIMILAVFLLLVAGVLTAANKGKDDKAPTVVVANGFFSGTLTNDGNGRSVLIVNTQTGDFEVFDIDRQGMERKSEGNEMYYSSIKYNRQEGTRQLVKYRLASDVKAGSADRE
jgi:hypothetical protein